MNSVHRKPQESSQSNSPEQIAKIEASEHCCNARNSLIHDIDQETLNTEQPGHRLKYLAALAERMELRTPSDAAAILHRYEFQRQKTYRTFDVTKLPAKQIERIVRREQQNGGELQATKITEQSEAEYFEHVDALKSSGKSNAEIIQILAHDPATPETEKAKLQQFSQIISLATSPQDQALIGEKVGALNLAQLPDPVSFIQHQIFDAPDQKTGFSETFQITVSEKFGITLVQNATIADMNRNLDQRVPIVNQKTGEVEGYKPAITKDNPIQVRPGIVIYVDLNGQKIYEDIQTGETFSFQSGLAGRTVDKTKLQFLGSRSGLLQRGIVNFFGLNLKNAAIPKDHELAKITAIQNALLGGTHGMSADVMSGNDQNLFTQKFLFLSQFGKSNAGSHSSDQMATSLQQLGITNSFDPLDVDLEKLAVAGDFLNAHSIVSGKASWLNLKQRLHNDSK